MDVLWWLIVGLLAGLLAESVLRVECAAGVLGDISAGVTGAVMGGVILRVLGVPTDGEALWNVMAAIVGAVTCLLLFRGVLGRHPAR